MKMENEVRRARLVKKGKQGKRDLLYVYLNEAEQYVLTYGIEFDEFAHSLSDLLNHLLLIKHQFDQGDYNSHTNFSFVPHEKLHRLVADNVYEYGDFSWVDFEEMEGVNALSGQEIAELLYLGHTKKHLRMPFNSHLRNRFAYLAHDDGWWSKIYFRQLSDCYRMLGEIIPDKLTEFRPEKSLFGLKKKRLYPQIPMDTLLSLKGFMKEGMLLSIKDVEQSRNRLKLPIWVMGDYSDMDTLYEEYEKLSKGSYDAFLIFDKKTREWR